MAGAETGRGERKATIRDVAARAGVSPSAVTIAVHDRPGVSATTKQRILKVADELGWRPNLTAATLSGRGIHTVGLAIARPARLLGLEPFYMEFLSGIESVLSARSCSLLLRLVEPDEEIEVHTQWWQSGRINGSILVDLGVDDARIPALSEIGLPAVAVGHPSLAGPFTAVWTDDAPAIKEAVRYLAALGHRTIGRVGGPPRLGHSMIRKAAFVEAIEELGLAGSSADADFSPIRAGAPAAACCSPPTARQRSCSTTTSWPWLPSMSPTSSACPSPATSRSSPGTTPNSAS